MEITISVPKNIENALIKKAEESGQDIRSVVEHIVEISVEPEAALASNADFERNMLLFAEGSDSTSIYKGTYSRTDLYADHD